MTRKFRHILTFALLLTVSAAIPAAAAAPQQSRKAQWEMVESLPADLVEPQNEHVEVIVRDGVIYISTPRPAQVKLFTILGQLVAQAQVAPGTARIRPAGRGIYILKAGSFTCRVTI